jgi:hypothetical protein
MAKHEYRIINFHSSEPTNVGGSSKKNHDGQTTYIGESLDGKFRHITVTMTGLDRTVRSMAGRRFTMTTEEIV